MRSRFLILALGCLLVGGLTVREETRGTFDGFYDGWVGWLAANVGHPERGRPEVTVIGISNEGQIFEAWPPSPGDYALILQNLVHYDPPVVGVTPALRWPEKGLLFSSLVQQIEALSAPQLGAILEQVPEEAGFIDPAIAGLFDPLEPVRGDLHGIPAFTGIRALPQDQVRAAGSLGFTGLEPLELKGNEVLLVARYGDRVVPSLALRLVAEKLEIPLSEVVISPGREIRIGERRVPIDSRGVMRVSAAQRTTLTRVSAGTLLLGPDPDPNLLEDGERIEDLLSLRQNAVVLGTPGSEDGERIAGAVAALLVGDPVQRMAVDPETAIWVLACLVGVIAGMLGGSRGLRIGAVALLLLPLGAALLFASEAQWFTPVVPAVLILAGIVLGWIRGPVVAPKPDKD